MRPLLPAPAIGWAAASAGVFHLSFTSPWGGWILAFPFTLLPLASLPTPRRTFYGGLALGLLLYAPHLGFFYTLFGPPAVILWTVLAFWIGLFLLLTRAFDTWLAEGASPRFAHPGWNWAGILGPAVFWTGCEYFRSELYFLRFSWLKLGDALAWSNPAQLLGLLGTYGLGTAAFLAAALVWRGRTSRARVAGCLLAAALLAATLPLPHRPAPSTTSPATARSLKVAGAQVESISDQELLPVLDALIQANPTADLIVLPEYSLANEPDDALRTWCRHHQRHLVVGGREPLGLQQFRNTAFVIDPTGAVVFRQTKSVPIQFFADGLPATHQSIWPSPWGPIGIAICYDLSYSRVMDHLVEQGAHALVIPTMDVAAWGLRQHQLHSRVAPLRAAEYSLPIVRVASSGISQIVDRQGRVTASAPFGEKVQFFSGTLTLAGPGRRPPDRWTSPAATVATGLAAAGLLLHSALRFRSPALPSDRPTP